MGSSTSSALERRRLGRVPGLATGPAAGLDTPPPPPPRAAADDQDAGSEDLAAKLDVWNILIHAKQHFAQRLAFVDCWNNSAPDPEDCANLTSYGQLYDHVLGLAGSLRSLGIGRGSRVAVMLRNCAEVCTTPCAVVCGALPAPPWAS
jgi:non-ribosomal peptide synthetase component E (peptide arylation enzyme)